MPSETLEIQKLMEQIDNDSSSSESEASTPIVNEPETTPDTYPALMQNAEQNTFGLCMAITTTGDLPKSWKQAVYVRHWKEAMEKEICELEAKGAWVLVDRTTNMKVLPGV